MTNHRPPSCLRRATAVRWPLWITAAAVALGGVYFFWPYTPPQRSAPDAKELHGRPFRTDPESDAPGNGSPAAPEVRSITRPAEARPIISPTIPGMIPIMLDPAKLATIGKDVDEDGTIRLSIDQLACYPYDLLLMNDWLLDPESASRPKQIPDEVLALHNKTVELRGYMMPITMFEEGTPMFLLLRDQAACCFGMAHGMNAWVRVEMVGKQRVGYVSGTPIAVRGVLEVREEIEDDMVMSIYRLRGERVRRLDGY